MFSPIAGTGAADPVQDDVFMRMSQSKLVALYRQMSQTQVTPPALTHHVALASTTNGVLRLEPFSGNVDGRCILDSGAS